MANHLTLDLLQHTANLTLDEARSQLLLEKTNNAAQLAQHKDEANKYATNSRLGQITITTGNLAALVALYMNTVNNSPSKFSASVEGLIIASVCLSGVLLLLQVGLANVRPPTKLGPDVVPGLFWQMFDQGHHLAGFVCYNIFCGFGSESPPKLPRGCICCPLASMENGQADGGVTAPANPAAASQGSTSTSAQEQPSPPADTRQTMQENGVAPVAIDRPPRAQTIEKPDSKPASGTSQQPPQSGQPVPQPAVADSTFTAVQGDLNVLITGLGAILMVLNAVIAGLTGTTLAAPSPAPSPK